MTGFEKIATDWLDMEGIEDSITHPKEGYDAIICLGNSFSHLPHNHTQAIRNFYNFLKPGGVLLIDHRNFDYILRHGDLPNSKSKLYYQGDRIQSIKTTLVTDKYGSNRLVLEYELDVSGLGIGSGQFSLSYYPHTLTGFSALLKGVFGATANHTVLPDFTAKVENEPSYYVHVIVK